MGKKLTINYRRSEEHPDHGATIVQFIEHLPEQARRRAGLPPKTFPFRFSPGLADPAYWEDRPIRWHVIDAWGPEDDSLKR